MSSDISNEMDLFGGSAATASSASAARFVPSADTTTTAFCKVRW